MADYEYSTRGGELFTREREQCRSFFIITAEVDLSYDSGSGPGFKILLENWVGCFFELLQVYTKLVYREKN